MTSFSAFTADEPCRVAAAFNQHRVWVLPAVVWTDRAEPTELAQVGEELEAGHGIQAVRLHATGNGACGRERNLKNDRILKAGNQNIIYRGFEFQQQF